MELFTRLGRLVKVKNTKTKSFTNENDEYISVLVKFDSDVRCLMFTETELAKALNRADKNIEDQPKQSWLSKILD